MSEVRSRMSEVGSKKSDIVCRSGMPDASTNDAFDLYLSPFTLHELSDL